MWVITNNFYSLYPQTIFLVKIDSTGYNVKTCYYCQEMRRPEINHFQVVATVANSKIPGDIIVRVRKEGEGGERDGCPVRFQRGNPISTLRFQRAEI